MPSHHRLATFMSYSNKTIIPIKIPEIELSGMLAGANWIVLLIVCDAMKYFWFLFILARVILCFDC